MRINNLDEMQSMLNDPLHKQIHKRKLDGVLFGIELENELDGEANISDFMLQAANVGGFHLTRDGSLRGSGYEFISSPNKSDVLLKGLKSLHEYSKTQAWSYSRRTSTHIHCNVSHLKTYDILKFLSVYWIIQPLLFLSAKPTRIGNAFCASSLDTREYLLDTIYNNKSLLRLANEDVLKYSSMNIYPMKSQGSLECRLFHSTFDPIEIGRWLHTFEAIYKFIEKYKTLRDLRTLYIQLTPEQFAVELLEKELANYYMQLAETSKKSFPDLLRDGFSYARPVLSFDKKWEELSQSFIKELERIKKRRELQVKEQKINDAFLDELLDNEIDIDEIDHQEPEDIEERDPQPQVNPAFGGVAWVNPFIIENPLHEVRFNARQINLNDVEENN